jgi:chromate transporter
VCIVSAFAWAYVHFGSLPTVAGLLYGVKPVIIAVVVQAIWGLVKPAMKTRFLMGLGVAALVLSMLGMDEVLLLFGAGVLAGLIRWTMPPADMPRPAAYGVLGLVLIAAAMVLVPTALTRVWSASASGADTGQGLPFGLTPLFLFFLKVGSVLYGSGYVLLAFLRDSLVTQLTGCEFCNWPYPLRISAIIHFSSSPPHVSHEAIAR